PATVAAKGVDFFEPLNPAFPAVPHATVLPRRSVIVIRTLLKVAEMCTIPSDSTSFFERLTLGLGAATGSVMDYFFVTFFLPAMARRGPFLVRALVWVR